jgi:hypothetical protein
MPVCFKRRVCLAHFECINFTCTLLYDSLKDEDAIASLESFRDLIKEFRAPYIINLSFDTFRAMQWTLFEDVLKP